MRKTLTLILAAATLGAGGMAYAQADTDQRGADMTRAQAQERAAAHFTRMDANQDGQIDAADRESRQRARFDRIDADSNGAISYSEFTTMHEQRGDRRAERGERRGKGGHHGWGGRGGRGGGGHMMMSNADANSDGTITQAEFNAGALTRFDAADADNNGTVTREERQAQRQEWRASRNAQPAS